MAIDWTATGAMLSGWGSIAGAAATAAGAGAVFWAAKKAATTVETWKLQKITERKFDHAQKTMVAAFNASEALAYVRGAMTMGHEESAAKQVLMTSPDWETVDEDRQRRLITAQVRVERLQQVNGSRSELADCRPLALALFGNELSEAISNLHHQFWIIRVLAEEQAEDTGRDRKYTIDLRNNLFSADPEKSEVAASISSSLAVIEAICLPVLRL